MTDPTDSFSRATLGGGCFWCLEAVFRRLGGVQHVVSGYAGGHVANPGYRAVCTGRTGHAEVVQIEFDPSVVTFRDLLAVFFTAHDPTTLNRQGNDVGTQYRSIVLHHDEEQRETAAAAIRELESSGVFADPVVTELQPYTEFYPAESYHRDYYEQNAAQPYCRIVIAPKLTKLRQRFAHLLRDTDSG